MKVGDFAMVISTHWYSNSSVLEEDLHNGAWVGRKVLLEELTSAGNWSVRWEPPNGGPADYDIFAPISLRPLDRRWTDVKKGDVYIEHIVDERSGTLREIEWVVAGKTSTHVKLQTADGWIHQRPLMDIALGTFK